VAPAIAQELLAALGRPPTDARRWHRGVTGYVSLGGALVLLVSLLVFLRSGRPEPPSLIAILTPANLFTGVLACGIIALSSLWMDRRWLPPPLQSPLALRAVNLIGGGLFVALGIKAYWDHGGLAALGILLLTLLVGWLVAALLGRLTD
jgi:hypothetical protein